MSTSAIRPSGYSDNETLFGLLNEDEQALVRSKLTSGYIACRMIRDEVGVFADQMSHDDLILFSAENERESLQYWAMTSIMAEAVNKVIDRETELSNMAKELNGLLNEI